MRRKRKVKGVSSFNQDVISNTERHTISDILPFGRVRLHTFHFLWQNVCVTVTDSRLTSVPTERGWLVYRDMYVCAGELTPCQDENLYLEKCEALMNTVQSNWLL